MKCKCGSYAINHHCHGRDGSDGDLCDVCYWRKRADSIQQHKDEIAVIAETVHIMAHNSICDKDSLVFVRDKLRKLVKENSSSHNMASTPCRLCINGIVSVSCKENCEPNSNACLKHYSAPVNH